MSDNLVVVYQDLINHVGNQLDKKNNPLEVSACLVKLGLSMYRTMLSEDEYFKMVDRIYELRDKVLPLTQLKTNEETLH